MNNATKQVSEIAHIRKIAGIIGVQDIINSYAFYDKESKQYRERMATKLHPITSIIKSATHTRKNLFGGTIEEDQADDPHWIFVLEKLQMQCINCPICGEYTSMNNTTYNGLGNIPTCDFDYETYGLDIDAHFDMLTENHDYDSHDEEEEEEEEEDYDF